MPDASIVPCKLVSEDVITLIIKANLLSPTRDHACPLQPSKEREYFVHVQDLIWC
uniref:Uncharacterized protein n=1 Tax=Arundo donax TaxID=35708 RepID=A0A0A9AWZ1_ARUDO